MRSFTAALFTTWLAHQVAAHGTVTQVTYNGVKEGGYTPSNAVGTKPKKTAAKGVVWAANDQDIGFLLPEDYNGPNIGCHFNSQPALKAVSMAAGESLELTWKNWPSTDPHPGVFLNYLAPANSSWGTNTADALKFFKISEFGYDPTVKNDKEDYGLATGSFKKAGKVSTVTIPADIAPGSYVLRHEIIALHEANDKNGAQNYPMCINIELSGTGTATPPGVPATAFYKATDPGILVSLYDDWDPKSYVLPGPPVYNKGVSGTGSSPSTVSSSPTTGDDSPSTTKPASSTSSGKSGKGKKGTSMARESTEKLRRHARDLGLA